MTRINSAIFLKYSSSFAFLTLLVVLSSTARAQSGVSASASSPRRLITQSINFTQLTVLHDNTHPFARSEFDRGLAPANLPMRRMLLVLNRTAAQESALSQFLDDQQNKNSSNYHHWLTPDGFGQRFGPSAGDLNAVTSWLRSQGFQVTSTSKGRTSIEFSGTAALVQQAFHTSIHKYVVNGEEHWANASDPSIPSALAPAIKGIVSLHNFPRHSYSTIVGAPPSFKPRPHAPVPFFTFTPQQTTYYGLGPTDFATIYNVLPLWNAGIDGTGQTIAIVGETNIHLSDIEAFRSLFGLPANDPAIIINGEDPGVDGDETEALLDVSWSGAVAKNATIDFVVSASTESTLGVDLSALYIVDNNLAPVLSESYGICEANLGSTGNAFYNSLWQQAAAQGITVVVSAGDGGSAGCDNFDSESAAVGGLAVSGFASTPYNVALGGTDFNQTPTTAPNYWNATNNPTTGASAKSYIPETTWNDSCAGLGINGCTYGSNLFNIIAGSGGPSSCATIAGSCSGYTKPSWQTGPGVPADGLRDLPDVSLFASNGFNGSFYILCQADAGLFGSGTCSLTDYTFIGVGGTSASAPTFAGIMALVNQKMAAQGLSSRQGNANYVLYQLAAQNGASCDSSTVSPTGNSCLFYDITQGNNSVPCDPNTPNCGPAPPDGDIGVLVDPNNLNNPAWVTTPGYDMASGLGSVNAENLVDQWNSITLTSTTTTLDKVSPVSLTHGQSVYVHATVSPQSGSGTPTGSVALMVAPSGNQSGIGSLALKNGAAAGNTTLFPGGTYNVTVHYPGDSTYGPSDSAPIQVTVGKENSTTNVTLTALNPATYAFQPIGTTLPYGTIFFLRSDATNSSGTSCIPNPTLAQVSCPTGTMAFTNNGKTLDNGTYTLNSQGYTEDQTLASEFNALGNYALQAQYSGDNSFNPSTNTLNATVTQGITDAEINVAGLSPSYNGTELVWIAYSGQAFQVDVPVYAWSILQAPTGTIAILENGSPLSGTISYNPRNGAISGNYSTGIFQWAYLAGYLNLTIDNPGNYTFTASYSGDPYYLASQTTYSVVVTVLDTTFNISTPIPNVTITAPGQSGTATVGLLSTDNFAGPVNITCTLPVAMTESTCPSVTANMLGSNVNAQLTITTTAPHQFTSSNQHKSIGLYGFGIFAGVFLLTIPRVKRCRLHLLSLLLLCAMAFIVSCGSSGTSTPPPMDPGTPAGTYTVNVTATSAGITRVASFSVTVQ